MNEIEPTPTITHEELEDVISKYLDTKYPPATAIDQVMSMDISKQLTQEIMNYLAKKLNP